MISQAEKASWNSIGVFKVSNVSGKRRELVPKKSSEDDPDMDGESSDSDDSDDEEEGGSGAPVLQANSSFFRFLVIYHLQGLLLDLLYIVPFFSLEQLRKVAHHGCVNRIRAMGQNPQICASWADSGHVQVGLIIQQCFLSFIVVCNLMIGNTFQYFLLQVWDFSSHLNALAESETEGIQGSSVFNQAPLVNFRGHKDEGYAIDWSPVVVGRLVTGNYREIILKNLFFAFRYYQAVIVKVTFFVFSGDCKNCIHFWEPTSDSTWNVDPTPFVGHSASVEDLQVHNCVVM